LLSISHFNICAFVSISDNLLRSHANHADNIATHAGISVTHHSNQNFDRTPFLDVSRSFEISVLHEILHVNSGVQYHSGINASAEAHGVVDHHFHNLIVLE
jgi:hypothetical protein